MTIKLDGNIREVTGSSVTRRLRKKNRLPAVIYGESGKENLYIDIDLKEFEKEYIKGGIETKIFEISVGGNSFELICYQMDLDPLSDRPRHLDFVTLKDKKEIKVIVPIKYVDRDKAIGLKNGGYVNVLVRKVQLLCDPKKIPPYIEVNCASLRLKQSIRLFDLKLPEGTKLISKKNYLLVRVIGRGKDVEDANPAAAAATATTATAQQATATKSGTATAPKK
jgi:large subunit ribosomal protein L25